jgi:hypothetical protein
MGANECEVSLLPTRKNSVIGLQISAASSRRRLIVFIQNYSRIRKWPRVMQPPLPTLHEETFCANSIEASPLSADKSHVPNQIQHPVAGARKHNTIFRQTEDS